MFLIEIRIIEVPSASALGQRRTSGALTWSWTGSVDCSAGLDWVDASRDASCKKGSYWLGS